MSEYTSEIIYIVAITYLLWPFLLNFKNKFKILFCLVGLVIILLNDFNEFLLSKILITFLLLVPLILLRFKFDSIRK
jgi:hypothetical protein